MNLLPHLVTAVLSAGLTLAAVTLLRDSGGPDSGDGPVHEGSSAGVAARGEASGSRLSGAVSASAQPADEGERRFVREALARERVRSEKARIRPEDDGVTVLGRILEDQADPGPLLADFERLQAHVARNAGPTVRHDSTGDLTVIAGTKVKPKDPWVIELGPGRFRFDGVLDYSGHKMEEVKAIEIRGSGMDRTTLVSSDNLVTVRTRLGSLRMSDLTVEVARNGVVDSRGDVAIAFERVRVESPHVEPGSSPFYFAGRFFLACRGCEFRHLEGAPRFHGQGIALFEDCAFVDVRSGFSGSGGAAVGSRVTLRNCTWHDSPGASSALVYRQAPEYTIQIQGGHVAFGRAGMNEDLRRERWGLAWVRTDPEPTFAGSETTLTIAYMLPLLEEAPLAPTMTPTALRLLGAPRSGPARFLLSAFDTKEQDTKGFEVWRTPSGVEMRPAQSTDGNGKPAEGSLTLAEALRRCGEPLTTPVDRVHYTKLWSGGGYVPAINVSWGNIGLLELRASDATKLPVPWTSAW